MPNLEDANPPHNPPRNHNQGPSLDPIEELRESLTLRHVALIRAAEDHSAVAERVPQYFTEQMEADFTSDLLKKIRESMRELESTRKDEKEEFLRKGKEVDRFFKEITTGLEHATKRAEYPLKCWMEKAALEEQRRRDAEAEELRRLAQSAVKDIDAAAPPAERIEAVERAVHIQHAAAVAERAAEAPIATMARIDTKMSSAGLKKVWVGTVKDVGLLDLEKLRPYLSLQVLQVALNAYVRAGNHELSGAEIKEQTEVGIR